MFADSIGELQNVEVLMVEAESVLHCVEDVLTVEEGDRALSAGSAVIRNSRNE